MDKQGLSDGEPWDTLGVGTTDLGVLFCTKLGSEYCDCLILFERLMSSSIESTIEAVISATLWSSFCHQTHHASWPSTLAMQPCSLFYERHCHLSLHHPSHHPSASRWAIWCCWSAMCSHVTAAHFTLPGRSNARIPGLHSARMCPPHYTFAPRTAPLGDTHISHQRSIPHSYPLIRPSKSRLEHRDSL